MFVISGHTLESNNRALLMSNPPLCRGQSEIRSKSSNERCGVASSQRIKNAFKKTAQAEFSRVGV
jgi:hypothetical protein